MYNHHWRRLWGKIEMSKVGKVVITDKSMGVSQLLMTRARTAPRESLRLWQIITVFSYMYTVRISIRYSINVYI